jgi:Sugar kinases, ribokinase family
VFAHTDLLFLNENEALRLSRQRDTRSALKKLSNLVPCVVIKRGARGAIGISEGKITSVPAFRIVTKETTGAGDSFAAGFVSSFLRGGSIGENLRSGNACGALSAMYAGGTAGQPDLSALNRFLKEH